jgi:hypothetical protein
VRCSRKTLVASLSAFLVFWVASSAEASVAILQKNHLDGVSALAVFDHVDVSGCITTEVAVFQQTGADTTLETGVRDSFKLAVVAISQSDVCAGIPIIEGFGTATPIAIQSPNDLSTASVSADIDFLNFIDLSHSALHLEAHFTARAKAVQSGTRQNFHFESLHFNSTAFSFIRDATAAASVTMNGVNYTSGVPARFASLERSRERSILLQRS